MPKAPSLVPHGRVGSSRVEEWPMHTTNLLADKALIFCVQLYKVSTQLNRVRAILKLPGDARV